MCDDMLRDPQHIFRRMWAAEPWGEMSESPPCWTRVRDSWWGYQSTSKYFDDLESGTHCFSNWYEGNEGRLGRRGPLFGATDAPAVLGFDEDIDNFCRVGQGCNGHAQCCVDHGFNILSLYGDRVPYNICRNLEWQVCATQGKLLGQSTRTIKFARSPKSLAPDGSTGKTLGRCKGWVPHDLPKGGIFGYATDDIFYLEVCLFNQLCKNGDDLFRLNQGDPFVCDLDPKRLRELEGILPAPREDDPYAERCEAWKLGRG